MLKPGRLVGSELLLGLAFARLLRRSWSHYSYDLPADPTGCPFGKWSRVLQTIFHGTLPSGVLAGPVN